MAITKQDATQATYRQEFYFVESNSVKRCRVNGKCQTWITRPTEFKLPVKFGLKTCFYITDGNADEFYTTMEEARATLTPKSPRGWDKIEA